MQKTRFFSHGSYVLMMMIGASLSQSCSLDGCPFYKLHGSIHIPPPSCWDGKLCFMHLCVVFFLHDEIGDVDLFLPLKVLSSNRCAWNFCHFLIVFVVRQSLDALASFNCMYIFGYQNGRD
jgi:hypothetical protein